MDDEFKKWDDFVEDKPELKAILGSLAQACQNLNIRVSAIEEALKRGKIDK